MSVGTRWWRRTPTASEVDPWGGPSDVTITPDQRSAPDDEHAEPDRAEPDRAEPDRAEPDRAEPDRAEQERAEQDRAEQDRAAKAEQERAERERREAEVAEQQRRAREREDEERRARDERAELEAERERERAEKERLDAERRAEEERRAADERAQAETMPTAEAVSPAVLRDEEEREAAARQASRADRRRRRKRVLVVLLIAVLAVAAVWVVPRAVALVLSFTGGSQPTTSAAVASAPPGTPPVSLPRGGTAILPAQRVVALAAPAGDAEAAAERLDGIATSFGRGDRPVLPALVVRTGDQAEAWRALAVARAHGQLMVVGVPTGTTDLEGALEPWERLLREPEVGVALDVAPGPPVATPEMDAVTSWLAGLVGEGNLPQKLLLVSDPTVAPFAAPPALAVVRSATLDRSASVAPGAGHGVELTDPAAPPSELLAATPEPDLVLYR